MTQAEEKTLRLREMKAEAKAFLKSGVHSLTNQGKLKRVKRHMRMKMITTSTARKKVSHTWLSKLSTTNPADYILAIKLRHAN